MNKDLLFERRLYLQIHRLYKECPRCYSSYIQSSKIPNCDTRDFNEKFSERLSKISHDNFCQKRLRIDYTTLIDSYFIYIYYENTVNEVFRIKKPT